MHDGSQYEAQARERMSVLVLVTVSSGACKGSVLVVKRQARDRKSVVVLVASVLAPVEQRSNCAIATA